MHKSLARSLPLFAAVLFFLPPAFTVHAEIYKWVDERGNVHYSDEKPDDHTTETVTPATEKMGVELTPPQNAEDWKQRALGDAPPSAQDAAQTIPAAAGTPIAGSTDTNQHDLCEGKVAACFTPAQDRVCLLRYGQYCWDIYYWKACLYQDCRDRRLVDKCDSPFYFLDNRPVVLGRRDVGRQLPLRESMSAQDWQCLSIHGFYCDEVNNETHCREDYNQSCDDLKSWVAVAKQRCVDNRDGDCDDLNILVRYRPAAREEVKKNGVRNAFGGITRYDLLFQSMDVNHNDAASNERLRPVLESITGVNVDTKRRWYDCSPQNRGIIDYH